MLCSDTTRLCVCVSRIFSVDKQTTREEEEKEDIVAPSSSVYTHRVERVFPTVLHYSSPRIGIAGANILRICKRRGGFH